MQTTNQIEQFAATERSVCAVCGGTCALLDVMDLNKSCGVNGEKIPLAGVPVYYVLCQSCGFCFAPQMHAWTAAQFTQYIYNDDYVQVDPDYVQARPRVNAVTLQKMFPALPANIKHLDYGGGNGLLAKLLREKGWNADSYEPLAPDAPAVQDLGKFDFITAFEVFEHVPDVAQLMSNLRALLADNGVILFSTLLSDGHITPQQRINWWYAAPRNGHISLFSRQSLVFTARKYGYQLGSFSNGLHVLFTQVPAWCAHIMRAG